MIKLENVSKTYANGVVGLRNVSLEIYEGEFVYITGKSGAGKSTLLKLINKELNSFEGLARVDRWNLSAIQDKNIYKLRRDIGMVFQDFKLLDYLTVYENVAYVLEVINTPPEEIEGLVVAALDKVGILEKRAAYPAQLSGGEQQRVSIARAICKSPKILIADEPTANLNPEMALDIMRLFYRINQEGVTVIMATHNWGVIRKAPQRVISLVDGEIESDRTKNHISIIISEDFTERI